MKSPTKMIRANGRGLAKLREVKIQTGVLKYAEGSALIEFGDTRVLVAASVEKRVPAFLVESGRGWVTAEYSMLPRATHSRSSREVSKGRISGRTAEIQRLIGRSLRAVVDLGYLAGQTLIVDCDVLQADGGTRTAAITGAYVAAVEALSRVFLIGDLERWPLGDSLAAVSVGLLGETPLLDLDYSEDQKAAVDMNVVATGGGRLVEVQGTGERRSFSRGEFDNLMDLALEGIAELTRHQSDVLKTTLEEVDSIRRQGRRRRAEPKDEAAMWGRPD